MKRFLIILIVNCTLFIANCIAQSITWQRIYRNPLGNDAEGYDICQLDNNNFVIVGLASGTIPSFYVLKLNQFGDTIFTKVFGLGGIANAVTASQDGGFVFTGDFGNAFAIKMNANGEILWSRDYNGGRGFDIKRTSDGGYIICGDKTVGFQFKGYICKTDSLGYVQWEKDYYNGQTVYFYSVEEAIEGNGYIISGTKDSTNGRIRGYILKINNLGDVLWEHIYSIGIDTYLYNLNKTNLGYVFAGNVYTYSNTDSSRAFIFKTDVNGNMVLLKIFPSLRRQAITRITTANSNKYYISFFTFNSNPVGYGTKIYSLDSTFDIIKQITLLPDTNSLMLYSLSGISNSTDIIGCGSTDQYQFSSLDGYAARLDSSLNQPPPIGIKNNSINDFYKFELHQNFPNPFNPQTSITTIISKNSNIRICIYDILGRTISVLANQVLQPGLHSFIVNANELKMSSGVYFYSMYIDGKYFVSKKMLFIK